LEDFFMATETVERPGTLDLPGLYEEDDVRDGADIRGPWIVILYNCDCHTFQDVESILQKATGCSLEKAQAVALEVHTRGRRHLLFRHAGGVRARRPDHRLDTPPGRDGPRLSPRRRKQAPYAPFP
jgi:hypothetical protein